MEVRGEPLDDQCDALTSLRVGDLVGNKYRIGSILGQGGMGVVLAARHIALDDWVAIKIMTGEPSERRNRRLFREARAVAKLKSEHTVRVLDVAALPSGRPYIVMEYLEGQDLKSLLEVRGKLAPGFSVLLALQACRALAEAHAARIVHRDIKPSNLILTHGADRAPRLKIVDFGIAKSLDDIAAGDSSTGGVLLGSPAFMSPEQIRCDSAVDPRTDIWSLGATLYTLISGRKPFESSSFAELCAAILREQPPPLESVPPALQQVIARALEKSLEKRWPSMSAFAEALQPFADEAAYDCVPSDCVPRQVNSPAQIDAPVVQFFGKGTTLSDREQPLTRALPQRARGWLTLAAGGVLTFATMAALVQRTPMVLGERHGPVLMTSGLRSVANVLDHRDRAPKERAWTPVDANDTPTQTSRPDTLNPATAVSASSVPVVDRRPLLPLGNESPGKRRTEVVRRPEQTKQLTEDELFQDNW